MTDTLNVELVVSRARDIVLGSLQGGALPTWRNSALTDGPPRRVHIDGS